MTKITTFYTLIISLIISFNGLSNSIDKNYSSLHNTLGKNQIYNPLEGYLSFRPDYETTYINNSKFLTIIDCPGSISVNNDPDVCGANVSWVPPTTNNGLYEIVRVTGPAPGSYFPVGGPVLIEYEEHVIATGLPTLEPRCQFNVTVIDNQAPTISPAILPDINESLDASCSFSIPDYTGLITALDNCTPSSLGQLPTIGTVISGSGTVQTISLIANDDNGNPSNIIFNITLVDALAPVADLATLADVTTQCEVTSLTFPTATDNCGGLVTVTNDATLPINGQGTTVVTWTYTDVNSNSSTQTQNIVITDVTAPVPDLATLPNITDQCSVASLTAPTATDNCGGTVTVTNDATLPINGQGTTVVTWTYTDVNSNSSTQTQNIVITDVTAPVPDLATLPNITDQCSVASLTAPTATDNCGGTVTVTNDATLPINGQGTTVVTWTYTDVNSNTSTQTQNIVITDVTAPVPDLATLPNVTAQCSVTSLTDPTATDNCGGLVTVTNDATLPINGQGTTVVTWTYTDVNSNSSTQTQNVVITDNTPPVPDLATLPNVTAQCSVTSLTDPTATDNCGGLVTVTNDATLPINGQGTTVVTWTYTDVNSNSSTQTQNIVITDVTAPVPDLATLPNVTAQCSVTSLTAPAATDNCGGLVTVTNDATLPINGQGTTVVTWTYTDVNSNSSTQTQNIVITDVTAPVQDLATLPNITDQCSVASLTAPTATDNCGGTVTVTNDATLPINGQGTTVVTWTYTDVNNNATTQTQNIVITDVTAPVPNLATLPNVTAQCSVTSLTAPTATDNCGGLVTVTNDATLPITVQGTTVIVWTYEDVNGNSSTQTQNVIITDTTPPNVICQSISITLNATGTANITTAQIDNGSTDNCGISSMALDIYTFNCSDLGTNTVNLTVYDASGNSSSCTATVTILDPASNASVTIASNDANNEICDGEILTFTATPVNAGTTQFYEWFINGVSEGTTAVPTFTPFPAPTADYTIVVYMTTDISACDPKQSNTLSILVHPLPIVNVSDYDFCIDDNTQSASPNTGGTWTSSNTGIATITNSGAITPVNSGTVTFTYTNTTTGCSSTTNAVTINPLPIVGNYPTDNTICVNETHSLSPSTGGTWTSNSPSVATITNEGVITGMSHGNVTFTFTNTATSCSVTSASIEVLDIPVIDSVTASPSTVCARENSILTASVAGAGTNNAILVNYDFNSGNIYDNLNGHEITGITSDVYSNIGFDRTQTGIASVAPPAFAANAAGTALRQIDNYQDGNNGLGGTEDNGNWRFEIDGPDLNNYQDFIVYFQAKRVALFGNYKRVRVQIQSPNYNGGNWDNNYADLPLPTNTTQWQDINIPLPPEVNNPTDLNIRLQVNDGSDYDYGNYNCYQVWEWIWWPFWGHYVTVCDDYGAHNIVEPHVLIDNFQVQASKAGGDFDYDWDVVSGDIGSLPATTTTHQITVTPNETTEYEVTVTNSDGCPATETVTVNVFPVPVLNVFVNYCPAPPNSNAVELQASPGFVTYVWNNGETTQTIYVDTAGTYQVIGITSDGCSVSTTINVATELVTDGDFTNFNAAAPSFNTEYSQRQGFYNGANNSGLYQEGTYAVNTSAYGTASGTPQGYHPNFHGRDHTNNGTGARNFLMVNGSSTTIDPPGPEGPRQRIIWEQTVTVEANTDYYFSAYAMNLNPASPARLQFEVNGVLVGSIANLNTAPKPTSESQVDLTNWVRFYSNPTWNSGVATTAIIRIRNLNTAPGGNDFALDDISFATLSTFIRLTSPIGADNQIICQSTVMDEITYDIGGGLTAPNIEWYLNGSATSLGLNVFPNGLSYTFDGLEYAINGTPTVFGNYTYEITTTSACDVKRATGSLIINEIPVVTIDPITSPICFADGSVPLQANLSGSATSGIWTTSGSGSFSPNNTDPNASYIFGFGDSSTITLTYTTDDPDGTGATGPCDAAFETVDIQITPYIMADANPTNIDYALILTNCSITTIALDANNVTGQWSATPNTGFFSDVIAHNSNFTGESGTSYTLTWTATNASPCGDTPSNLVINIPDCGSNIIFEGAGDNISFGDNYNQIGSFSLEAWIKPNNVSGTKTIISKRNGTSTASGYDLSLVGNNLRFRYNSSQITATTGQSISSTKWYHVAITYDGASYTMYIDGFFIRAASGASPGTNTNKALIGAMDRTNNSPINYFTGGIDEVRIWNTALSQSQIREMMNQEIKQSGSNVIGEEIPLDITGPLLWNDLRGYYQMNTGLQTNIIAGNIQDISSSPVPGKLNAMTSNQSETAPIPYISIGNNTTWDNATTWSAGSVQQIPNSRDRNIVPNSLQTWNIVRTRTNVTTNRPAGIPEVGITTVHGLIVDSNTLSISNDQPLYVNKYLKIDGTLDLIGESQLLQPMGSIVDYSGSGVLHRDQQGTTNLYNYNYWSSPVSTDGNTYQIGSVLYSGSLPISWIAANDATGSTNPVTLSSRWLYLYENFPAGNYADWTPINPAYNVPVGLGYTMKGSGNGTAPSYPELQNYTFVGKPNNGTLTSPVTGGNEALVGNPYPSAIDANLFIADNQGSITGPIYFWEHSKTNASHITADYEGGYATYSLSGGIGATSPPPGIAGIGVVGLVPKRYIPVSQGYYVTGDTDGGLITFNNSQRIFKTQASGDSVFLRTENDEDNENNEELIKRVRLNFTTPEGAIRPLLLAFTPNNEATDGVDYGYDAKNADYFPSDMSFIIEDEKYVIQGVGQFNDDNIYPVTLDLGISGTIQIELTDLENFDNPIDVYVYDALLSTYSRINTVNYQIALDAGSHANRYFITFKEDAILNIVDEEFSNVVVNFLNATSEIYINVPTSIDIKQVYLVNMLGQTVRSWNATNAPLAHECKLPVSKISEGTYIIKVRTSDNKLINKKIVIDQN
ncbi:HYR-like domain-containing protein [Bizionia arctica]|uniref:HYR domain-containing protein n=1 Tax=Bizionia arctica TaxID=1495645 RepID=A0A917LMD4_9FLAO|nr:LamG-like jellyroll fold domain-containing protein [Bizionia arctica]GGG43992.1 hypothetical protein GCM10010976_14490 [Bizionia arctica]